MDEVAKRIAEVATRWESNHKRILDDMGSYSVSEASMAVLDLCRLASGQAAKIESMEARLREVERLLGVVN